MVGGLEKVIYLPAMLTQQLGYFTKNDIDVNLMGEQSGSTAETALLTGMCRCGGLYDHTIDLQARTVHHLGGPVRGRSGEVELVSKEDAGNIKSPSEFRGKNLGVTSPDPPPTSSPKPSPGRPA
jgi:NitT/TauT family transport system substrate-binding protein